MISKNPIVQTVLEVFARKGMQHFVFSPGSRNAPIAISAFNDSRFTCKVVADERSSGFIAMGMALELQQPVVVCCTSGTAVLNYAPAVAEAHYQNIPLIVLSADRPDEYIDQGEGQSIQQVNALQNFVNKSLHLPKVVNTKDELWGLERTVNEVVDACRMPSQGPVHINMPLAEPLYESVEASDITPKIINIAPQANDLSNATWEELKHEWQGAQKILVLCGQMTPNPLLNHILNELAADTSVVVLAENISNLYSPRYVACIDRVIGSIEDNNLETFTPDILVTIGGAVVSKRIKSLLRKMEIKAHWDVNPNRQHYDTYQKLTRSLNIAPERFFEETNIVKEKLPSNYQNNWKTIDYKNKEKHDTYLSTVPFSDLKTFAYLQDFLPEGVTLHLSNSSVIRYAQLFDTLKDVVYQSNRGVSGIDGSTSTALGCSLINDNVNLLVTGDISFFYDSNALWNKYLHPKFKIILINNSGGGIFRYIPGPSDTNILEEFFEAKQSYTAEHICKTFGVEYLSASNEQELERSLETLLTTFDAPMLLEVFTPNELNAQLLKDYFKYIK